MQIHKLLSVLLFATILAACGSTPRSNYYMLSADAQGRPGSEGPMLGVGPVTVPQYLKAREMVLNRSDHKLKMAEYDRWAEPLDDGVSRVVAVNLAILVKTNSVQIFPWRRDAIPEYAVRIAVVQFAVHGSEARLVAEWAISDPRKGVSVGHNIEQFTTTANAEEPESVAAAYSNLLLQLSEDIAADIRDRVQTGSET